MRNTTVIFLTGAATARNRSKIELFAPILAATSICAHKIEKVMFRSEKQEIRKTADGPFE